MRFNLIDVLVIGAVLAVLLLAARQDFPHYAQDSAGDAGTNEADK